MKKYISSFVILLVLTACNDEVKQSNSDSSAVSTPVATVPQEPETVSDTLASKKMNDYSVKSGNKRWKYDTLQGLASHQAKPSATILSENALELKPPYNGNNPASLIIMKNHGVTNLIIAITKGKFKMDVDGATIQAKFDNGAFEKYVCTKSNNGEPTMLFVDNSDKFINEISKAKNLIVEAEIEQNGLQTMKFDVDGLNWK